MNDMWIDFLFVEPCTHLKTVGLLGGSIIPAASSVLLEEEYILNPFRFGSFRNFLVMYCSFVDGLDRGIRFPIIYILKTKFVLSQAVAFTAFGLSLSPWLAKPFLALMTETVPVMGYRRKPYVIGSAVVNAVSLGLIGYFCATTVGGFVIPMSLMALRTFCRAITGSVIEGMLIEDCRGLELAANQSRTSVLVSQYHTSHRLGQFISVAASGVRLSGGYTSFIFGSMTAFHAGSIALSL